ncbi:MAG TPA: MMPL family transporter [Gammaproteobacteria bacterium]
MPNKITLYYQQAILKHFVSVIITILVISLFFAYHIPKFKLDASADSLVLENDQALKYYRSIKARYGSDDFLIITYTPSQNLFSTEILTDLAELRDQLQLLDNVESVVTIHDVPLTQSPPVSLSELNREVRTLETADVDIIQARNELINSQLYRNMLISPDGLTTAIQVNFKRDETYYRLLKQRNQLREKQLTQALTIEEERLLSEVSKQFHQYSYKLQDQEKQLIEQVRLIMSRHTNMASMHLGGVPMIAADSLAYIQNDLQTFGAGVIIFIVLILAISFRRPRWVIFAMLSCFLTGVIMIGLLGLLDWRVTVVSSNFISLLLIITLSMVIHLIVRYRELHALNPDYDQATLIAETIRTKFLPTFYTAITTMVAFASLIVSDIRPVIDFGWMMVIGISVAFVLTFTFFPASMMLFKSGQPDSLRNITGAITGFFAQLIQQHSAAVLLVYGLFITISIIGITLLTVENRFIDYYKQDTEIYRGMELIDQQLGGTTPLDVIIDAPASFLNKSDQSNLDLIDPFNSEFDLDMGDSSGGFTASSYWFNYARMGLVEDIHTYLDKLPETGKVLSIYTTVSMMEQLRDNEYLDDFFLSIIYKRVPDSIRDSLFTPYLSQDGNQIRFSVRIFESNKNLQRNALIEKIKADLTTQFSLNREQIHLSGMAVLYNNMLQSLYKSQILTIGVVFLAIALMFIILFRSFSLAAIAIIPNITAAVMVLGLMGVLKIPLDIMTITIAAICIGIAVDDTIHYVHRYKEEFRKDNDYWKTVYRCHASIGRAMYYTTIVITLGFSILALSNFIPMIYFGLLIGFSMLVALLADLSLLPLLIALLKPRIS